MVSGIYAYIDKTNDEIVYIGKDSHIDKNTRHQAHFYKSNYNKQLINKILQNNPDRYEYRILYAGEFDEILLNTLEINSITEENPKFNFTTGGDGSTGYVHTEETKKKISELKKGKKHPMYGKHLSQETKRKIGLSNSQQKNITGYYRVYKAKCNKCKQGFVYRYEYPYDNGKRKSITSVNIKKLEEKVKKAGLEWIKLEK